MEVQKFESRWLFVRERKLINCLKGLMPTPTKFDSSALRAHVAERMAELSVPSVAIGIWKDGAILFEEGFGLADVENQIPATPDTAYSIASITKPMIATLVAQAAADGLIDLNAPIEDYLMGATLTAWAGKSADATVSRVAHHTAGLPTHFHFYFDGEDPIPPYWRATVERWGNLIRKPGSGYCYSNIGYGFLGFLLEQVYTKPLADICQERLFGPLNMQTAWFAQEPGNRNLAVRYDRENKLLPHFVTDHPAGSEAFCSVRDLLKFGVFHLHPDRYPSFKADSIFAMRDPSETAQFEVQYGLGWGLTSTQDGLPVFGHTGGMDGVTTRLLLFPTEDLVVTILSNRESSIMFDVGTMIYEMLGVPLRRNTPAEQDKSVPAHAIGYWTGTVHTSSEPLTFKISVAIDRTVELIWEGEKVSNDMSFSNGKLVGKADCKILSPDTEGLTHKIGFELAFQDGSAVGTATAWSEHPARCGNAIPFAATAIRA